MDWSERGGWSAPRGGGISGVGHGGGGRPGGCRTGRPGTTFCRTCHLPEKLLCRGRSVSPGTTFCRTCHLPEKLLCRGRSVTPGTTFCRTFHLPEQILCRGRSVTPGTTFCRTCHLPEKILCRGRSGVARAQIRTGSAHARRRGVALVPKGVCLLLVRQGGGAGAGAGGERHECCRRSPRGGAREHRATRRAGLREARRVGQDAPWHRGKGAPGGEGVAWVTRAAAPGSWSEPRHKDALDIVHFAAAIHIGVLHPGRRRAQGPP